ncbi:MAG: outer membrane lipoprotein carrier protein LolA [Calditrichaeota bacterium]|nr:outer membrane lipoprotein carrier protein LolA [Calditrichota bacterium]
MKRILWGLLMTVFFVVNFTALRADVKADKIVKQILAKYKNSKTFKADFEQTYYWVLTDNTAVQRGTIWLEGKDKFKIQTENQLIVSDGKTVWTYSKNTNQALIDNVQKAEDITLPGDVMLRFLDKYRATYIGEERADGIACQRLELTANSGDQFIQKVILWVGKKDPIVRQIEQIDLNKNTSTYHLKGIEFDTPFAKDFFHYSPPDSVEVIDMR